MSAPATVTVDSLTVVRGSTRAVDGVTLSLTAGTVTGLLGPSGCGKTTLMRTIVGSQRPTAGSVQVLDHAAGAAPIRGQVGYMAQIPALYSDLTVTENLAYFGAVLGVGRTRIDDVIERVDLTERRSAMVRTLSGGEANRVSLAVALLDDPRVLILDEPTVGLDPILRRDLWSQFRTLADAGATLLVSSHVMEEAERCDRLLLMRAGRLLFDGDHAQLVAAADGEDIESAFIRLAEGESP